MHAVSAQVIIEWLGKNMDLGSNGLPMNLLSDWE